MTEIERKELQERYRDELIAEMKNVTVTQNIKRMTEILKAKMLIKHAWPKRLVNSIYLYQVNGEIQPGYNKDFV